MCLLVVGWKDARRIIRLIIAGNRDEFHERPAAPLGWWKDGSPPVLAGRDLKARGTWLGLARDGRFGIVTNFRDFDPPPAGAPTRGELVPSTICGARRAPHNIWPGSSAELASMVVSTCCSAIATRCITSRIAATRPAVAPGRDLRAFEPVARHALAQAHSHPGAIRRSHVRRRPRCRGTLRIARGSNHDRGCGSAAHRPARDWERAVSAPFVVHERYGTPLLDGRVRRPGRADASVHERRFDPGGVQTGASRFAFAIGPTASAATAVSRERPAPRRVLRPATRRPNDARRARA